jgi:tetrahydromethanopterin S-methyltransferase subunit G
VRFYLRTGRSSGVSVGIVSGLVLGLLLAVAWFYLALIIAEVLLLAGILYGVCAVARRRH